MVDLRKNATVTVNNTVAKEIETMEKMTKVELVAKAKELGMKGYSKMTKAQLIDAIAEEMANKVVGEPMDTVEALAMAVTDHLNNVYGVEAHYNRVAKNNQILHGVSIKTDDSNIHPTVYVDDLVKECHGQVSEIAIKVIEICENAKANTPVNIQAVTEMLSDFDKLKENLYCRLVNTETNKEMLSECPHYEMEDLSVIFSYRLPESDEQGLMSVVIKNPMMESLGITIDDLKANAKFDTNIKTMAQTMAEMMNLTPEELGIPDDYNMVVITNKDKANGASCILDTDAMEDLSKKMGGNFYILPSSIHECLAVIQDGAVDVESLRTMVQEVNDTQVAPADLLSYSVYEYIATEKKIVKVA